MLCYCMLDFCGTCWLFDLLGKSYLHQTRLKWRPRPAVENDVGASVLRKVVELTVRWHLTRSGKLELLSSAISWWSRTSLIDQAWQPSPSDYNSALHQNVVPIRGFKLFDQVISSVRDTLIPAFRYHVRLRNREV